MKTIAVIASLDTKGVEVEFARGLINQLGCKAFLIDTSVRLSPTIVPDVSCEEVIAASGISRETILTSDKGKRIELMASAITSKVKALYEEGKFDAVFSMGGVQNTVMATSAMKALPVGVPKMMLTTVASGRRIFDPFIGTKDVTIMHSVADVSGTNFITKSVIGNAIAGIVGMATMGSGRIQKQQGTVIGASMMGITGDGVVQATRLLEKHGYEVVTFHATGVGGRALEELIDQGMINSVLDMTLHEVTSEILGGYSTGAMGRLEAAARAGIPQVIVPGAVDMIDFATDENGNPALQVASREMKYYHNSGIIHAKVTQAEIMMVAELIAGRVNKSKGPVTVLIPLRGFCEAGAPGGKLCDPVVDKAFIATLRQSLNPNIKLVEADNNINDPEFAALAANLLLECLAR